MEHETEQNVLLEVKLSIIIHASVGEDNPLSREGVAELVHDYVTQAGVGFTIAEGMIDSVRVLGLDAPNGRTIIGTNLLGARES